MSDRLIPRVRFGGGHPGYLASVASGCAALATIVACVLAIGCVRPRSLLPPVWRVVDAPPELIGCAEVDAWIVKSGREGIGVTLSLRSAADTCSVKVERALVSVTGDAEYGDARLPAGPISIGAVPVHVYFPIYFDNLAPWRRGARHGHLALTFTVAPSPVAWSDPAARRTTTIYRPMDQRVRSTWMLETEADAIRERDRKAPCASFTWVGGDGTDRFFRAVIELATDQPWCVLTVEAAQLAAYAGAGPAAAPNLPKSFTLAYGQPGYLILDFPAGPDQRFDRPVLHFSVREPAGALSSMRWPLEMRDAFHAGGSMPWQ